MAADIVPVLAAITGLEEQQANTLFTQAWQQAKAVNGGRADTKAFSEAIMAFRAAAPFDLTDLQAGWKAKAELESDPTNGNTLPMPR